MGTVVSNCDMCLLSVKMWSSLAHGLVEQGSEAFAQLHNKSNSLYFYLLLILQIKVGLENKQILLCKL